LKTIDIQTTQKVSVTYEIATFWQRLLALALDLVLVVLSCSILGVAFGALFNSNKVAMMILSLLVTTIIFGHALSSEIIFKGQTFGKYVLGIKVVKLNGTKLKGIDSAIRWCFKLVDVFLSLGSIAAVTMNSTNKGQRLGDLLANTTVIKIKADKKIVLNDILSIKTTSNYTPVYLAVKSFKEQDMLLIKDVLDRNKNYPSEANEKALNEVFKIVVEKIDVPAPKDKVKFLNTLIKDYIVLTR